MINNKVSPDKYQEMRRQFFNFLSDNQLTIREAKSVLTLLETDLQDMVCSGQYGGNECTSDEIVANENWPAQRTSQ